jgi:hypothetical protein
MEFFWYTGRVGSGEGSFHGRNDGTFNYMVLGQQVQR